MIDVSIVWISNELPHPQVFFAPGFIILKNPPAKLSAKSNSHPFKNFAENSSMTSISSRIVSPGFVSFVMVYIYCIPEQPPLSTEIRKRC